MTICIAVLVAAAAGVFAVVAVRGAAYKNPDNDDYRFSTGQFGTPERRDRFKYRVYRTVKKGYGDGARIFADVPFRVDRYRTEVIDLLAVTPDGLVPFFIYDSPGKGKLYIRGGLADPEWRGVRLGKRGRVRSEKAMPSFLVRADTACTLLDAWIGDNALLFSDYRDNGILPEVCPPVVVYPDRMVFQLTGNAPDWITWGRTKDVGRFIKARMPQRAWTGYDIAQASETWEDIFALVYGGRAA